METCRAGYIVIGSPNQVIEQMTNCDNLNVGNLMLLMQFGNMNKELTRYNSRLFAEKVMPTLKKFLQRMGTSLVAAANG